METCSVFVGSTEEYHCSHKHKDCPCKKPRTLHAFKDYKKFQPRWDVPPDNSGDQSKYWKWYVCQYKAELAEKHGYDKPEDIRTWENIEKEHAIESLKVYRG